MSKEIVIEVERLEKFLKKVEKDYSYEQLENSGFISSSDEMILQLFNDCIDNTCAKMSMHMNYKENLDLTSFDDDFRKLLELILSKAEDKLKQIGIKSYRLLLDDLGERKHDFLEYEIKHYVEIEQAVNLYFDKIYKHNKATIKSMCFTILYSIMNSDYYFKNKHGYLLKYENETDFTREELKYIYTNIFEKNSLFFELFFESKSTIFYDNVMEYNNIQMKRQIDEKLLLLITNLETKGLNFDLNRMLYNNYLSKLDPDIICDKKEETYIIDFKNYVGGLLYNNLDYKYNGVKYYKFVNTIIHQQNDKILKAKLRSVLNRNDFSLYLNYLFHVTVLGKTKQEEWNNNISLIYDEFKKKVPNIRFGDMIEIINEHISNNLILDDEYYKMLQRYSIFDIEDAKQIYNYIENMDDFKKELIHNYSLLTEMSFIYRKYDQNVAHLAVNDMIKIMFEQISNKYVLNEEYYKMVQNNSVFNRDEAEQIYNFVNNLDQTMKEQIINYLNDPKSCNDDIDIENSKYRVNDTDISNFKIIYYDDVKHDLEEIKKELMTNDDFRTCLSLDDYIVDGEFKTDIQSAIDVYQRFTNKIGELSKGETDAIIYNDERDIKFVNSAIKLARINNKALNDLFKYFRAYRHLYEPYLAKILFEQNIIRSNFEDYVADERNEEFLFKIIVNITLNQINNHLSENVLSYAIESNYRLYHKEIEYLIKHIKKYNYRIKLIHAGKIAKTSS